MNAGAAGVVAANAAIASAIQACGTIVRVEPGDFLAIISRSEAPLVVYAHSQGWFVTAKEQYLTSYRGLAFFTRSSTPLELPEGVELIHAQRMWVPG